MAFIFWVLLVVWVVGFSCWGVTKADAWCGRGMDARHENFKRFYDNRLANKMTSAGRDEYWREAHRKNDRCWDTRKWNWASFCIYMASSLVLFFGVGIGAIGIAATWPW